MRAGISIGKVDGDVKIEGGFSANQVERSLRQAIAEVFDALNSNPESDLTLRFRAPLSKNLLNLA